MFLDGWHNIRSKGATLTFPRTVRKHSGFGADFGFNASRRDASCTAATAIWS